LQHVEPSTRLRFGLGDLLHFLILAATLGRVKMCPGCASRRARLNRLFSVRIPRRRSHPKP
jgi:hypothetical protein